MLNVTQEKIHNDLYIILKTVFHYERIGNQLFGLKIEEMYSMEYMRLNPNARVTDIAREMKLPMFTVSRMISRLVEQGLVTKTQLRTDRRNYTLELTKQGVIRLSEIDRFNFQRISTNLKTLTEDQVNEIFRIASRLHLVLGVTDDVIH